MNSDTMPSVSDDDMIVLDTFVTQSYGKLHRYALSLLSPSAASLAEDLVQEAYTRLLMHIRRGSPVFDRFEQTPEPTDMVRYMQVVVKHVFLDMVQYGRIEMQSVSLDTDLELGDDSISIQIPDEYSDVEKVVLHQEAATEFGYHVALLPTRTRNVIQLKMDGLSSQEIAEKFSVSPSAIRVAFMRGKHSLRKIIEEHPRQSLPADQWTHIHRGGRTSNSAHEVAQLPAPYQMIVTLHGIRRTSYREVAHSLNRSIGTVKSQYSRGIHLLENQKRSTVLLNISAQELLESVKVQLTHIERLDGRLQKIVLLHYEGRLSYTEIAKQLGCKKETIKVQVHRAMKKLQQHVESPNVSMPKKPSSRRQDLGPIGDEHTYIVHIHKTYQIVMNKYYIQQLDAPTIAKQLDMPRSTVWYKIRTGKKALREKIQEMHVKSDQAS